MLLTCIKTTVGIKIFGADLIQRLGEQIERIVCAAALVLYISAILSPKCTRSHRD